MAPFVVSRRHPAGPRAGVGRVVDWPRHGAHVPLTTVTAGGPARSGSGTVVTARTGVGRFGFDDPMEIVEWDPPRGGGPGSCRLREARVGGPRLGGDHRGAAPVRVAGDVVRGGRAGRAATVRVRARRPSVGRVVFGAGAAPPARRTLISRMSARVWSTSSAICRTRASTRSNLTMPRSRATNSTPSVVAVEVALEVQDVGLDPALAHLEGRVGADRDRRHADGRGLDGAAPLVQAHDPPGVDAVGRDRRPTARCAGSRSGSRGRGRAGRRARRPRRRGADGPAPASRSATSPALHARADVGRAQRGVALAQQRHAVRGEAEGLARAGRAGPRRRRPCARTGSSPPRRPPTACSRSTRAWCTNSSGAIRENSRVNGSAQNTSTPRSADEFGTAHDAGQHRRVRSRPHHLGRMRHERDQHRRDAPLGADPHRLAR